MQNDCRCYIYIYCGFKNISLLVLWELSTCFDHIHPAFPTSYLSIPLSYPSKFVFFFFNSPASSNLCCANILGYVAFHLSTVHFLGTILFKKNWSQQLSVAKSSLAKGGASCPASLSMLECGLTWACIDGVCAVVTTVKLPCCVQRTLLLTVIHHFWLFHSFHLLFHSNHWALGGGGIVNMFHLRLSIPQSLILWTLANRGLTIPLS